MIPWLRFIKTNWIAFTVVNLALITIMSLWPLDELPSVPGTDRIHHIIAYAILSIPAGLHRPDRWIFFGLLFIAYGGAIELLQPYVNRYGEWADMLANTAGVVCGLFIARRVNFFSRR